MSSDELTQGNFLLTPKFKFNLKFGQHQWTFLASISPRVAPMISIVISTVSFTGMALFALIQSITG